MMLGCVFRVTEEVAPFLMHLEHAVTAREWIPGQAPYFPIVQIHRCIAPGVGAFAYNGDFTHSGIWKRIIKFLLSLFRFLGQRISVFKLTDMSDFFAQIVI